MRMLSLTFAVALAGCATVPSPVGTGDGLTYASLGQTVSLGGPKLTPLALLEDSRCPSGEQCIWAGQVRVSARIATGRGESVAELATGKPIAVSDGTLTLVAVEPAKRADAAISPNAYRFGFRFEGGF